MARAKSKRPNILILWGDDVDSFNMLPYLTGEVKKSPRQKPASFNLDAVLRTLEDASGGGQH